MRKTAIVVARGKAGHQQSWGGAFVEGLQRHGWHARISETYDPADLIIVWSVRRKDLLARAKADGCEICILERGYVGDRFKYTSVSFGGELNGRAEFRGPLNDPSRWQQHFAGLMKPWRPRQDGYALLIGQVPGDMSVKHVQIDAWYQQTAVALRKFGWDVRFRKHPKAGAGARVPHGVKELQGTLQHALDGAGIAVSFNSNTGVDAALAGVPVVAMDEGSMAWPVAGHQVDEILMPDRAAWARRLAWCQWSIDEIRSGYCWEMIGQ